MAISTPPHFVLFPFMPQGHTIPLLYLADILSDRHISVTVITTPANHSTVKTTVKNNPNISVINIPSPDIGLPPAAKLTDQPLPPLTFLNFLESTQQLQPQFEHVVRGIQPVTCIISDSFLIWTQDSAEKLGIPRLVFNGKNIFFMTMINIMKLVVSSGTGNTGKEFSVPGFPRIKLTVADFVPSFPAVDPAMDFGVRQQKAAVRSHGMVVNSFYELEPEFNEYWNRNCAPKAWLVGPFCVAKSPSPVAADEGFPIKTLKKPAWIEWLDMKLAANEAVLYVSFGSHAEASTEQLLKVATGLEQSNVSFVWVMKPNQLQLLEARFAESVKGRGKVVAEWVEQMEILKHEIVCGFLSHCGWNSVLESICAGVPILAMPLMSDQHLNARMVVEEIGMGLRLWPRNMSARGVVEAEEVAKMVVELMEGEGGRRVKKRAKEVREGAYGAMKEGGSSAQTLDLLIDHVSENREPSTC